MNSVGRHLATTSATPAAAPELTKAREMEATAMELLAELEKNQ